LGQHRQILQTFFVGQSSVGELARLKHSHQYSCLKSKQLFATKCNPRFPQYTGLILRDQLSSKQMMAGSSMADDNSNIPVSHLSFDEIESILNDWSEVCAIDSKYEENEQTVCCYTP
jgi:hypothetical protein